MLNRVAFTGRCARWSLVASCVTCASFFGILTYGFFLINYDVKYTMASGTICMIYMSCANVGHGYLKRVQDLVKLEILDLGLILTRNRVIDPRRDLRTKNDSNRFTEECISVSDEGDLSLLEKEDLSLVYEDNIAVKSYEDNVSIRSFEDNISVSNEDNPSRAYVGEDLSIIYGDNNSREYFEENLSMADEGSISETEEGNLSFIDDDNISVPDESFKCKNQTEVSQS